MIDSAQASDIERTEYETSQAERHNSFHHVEPTYRKRSLSGLSAKVDGLRTWSGRTHKGRLSIRSLLGHSKESGEYLGANATEVFEEEDERDDGGRSRQSTNWLRRAASTTLRRNRRPSNSSGFVSHDESSRILQSPAAIPEVECDLPVGTLNVSGGAAARAAAAAQNELFESTRAQLPRERVRLEEPKVANDSESGIGLDARDEPEDELCADIPITRQGK